MKCITLILDGSVFAAIKGTTCPTEKVELAIREHVCADIVQVVPGTLPEHLELDISVPFKVNASNDEGDVVEIEFSAKLVELY